jgi:hypothetical protein
MPPINPSDAMTIQAFTAMLPQLDTALSPELKQAVHRIGRSISTHQPEAAANQIRDLVQTHQCMKKPFQTAYDRLQSKHQAHDRRQALTPTAVSSTSPLNLDDITVPILAADDFRSAAKGLLKKMESRIQQAPDDIQAYAMSLKYSVVQADEQAIALLKNMDKRLRTPKELAHEMGLQLDQVQEILQLLWKKGYVEPATGSALYKVLPMLRTRHSSEAIDAHTYFTLTTKGHFFLHPVISFDHQSRTLL